MLTGPFKRVTTPVTRPTPAGERTVYVHVVATRVRKLYRCQVVILREAHQAVEAARGVVYVHCKIGYSRSADRLALSGSRCVRL